MSVKQELTGDWNTVAGNVKQKYGAITDDELREVEGNADKLIGLIQRKSGQAREQVEAYVGSIFSAASSATASATEMAKDYTESTSRAVREGYEQVADRARDGYQQSANMVSERPIESVVAAFGVGLIAGIVVGLAIGGQRQQPTWRDRWVS